MTAEKSSSSQLRAISKTARERVFPVPSTPAIQRSDRPVRMASNSATVTVRMWPSPCPVKASKLSRKYKLCGDLQLFDLVGAFLNVSEEEMSIQYLARPLHMGVLQSSQDCSSAL